MEVFLGRVEKEPFAAVEILARYFISRGKQAIVFGRCLKYIHQKSG